jgi:hypothetical protein
MMVINENGYMDIYKNKERVKLNSPKRRKNEVKKE